MPFDGEVLKYSLSIAFVIAAIYFLWYLLWKLALEPNPLIRDFFDLDKSEAKLN